MPSMDLAHYDSIKKWSPQIGDFIIWHGWFQHYFGVISGINKDDNSVEVIKQGLPLLLFDMPVEQHEKFKTKVGIGEIKASRGGKYAALRASGSNVIWYI
jgi:hypothetical protein